MKVTKLPAPAIPNVVSKALLREALINRGLGPAYRTWLAAFEQSDPDMYGVFEDASEIHPQKPNTAPLIESCRATLAISPDELAVILAEAAL